MATVDVGGNGVAGIRFLVSAGYVYEVVAAACSSPQTMMINAAKRGPSLMFWVHAGIVQALFFVAIAAYLDRAHKWEYIWGAALAIGILYAQYMYAYNEGQKKMGGSTEG